MKSTLHYSLFLFCWILLFVPNQLAAQIGAEFENLVNKFLIEDIQGPDKLDKNKHGEHFRPAADKAKVSIVEALNRLIASNISSFPLNSTTAGISFDFSTGQPVSIRESLGPIFAETGKTLGKGKMNFGFNFTLLDFKKLRGLDTKEITFNFYHQDVKEDGKVLGDSPNESDVMNVNLDLNLDASIFVFYLTTGITENLDISVALPLVSLTLEGTPTATFNSFTLASGGIANHNFGFEQDSISPILTTNYTYDNRPITGIGDVAVRLKYSFLQEGINFGALLDARLPTGSKENSLGTGNTNIRLLALFSKKINDFTPHLNVGYDYRGDEFDSNEFEFALGFDQKITSGLTFAFDVLGEIDTDVSDALTTSSNTTTITDFNPEKDSEGEKQWQSTRIFNDSNILDIKDHIINAAFGIRFAPSDRLQVLGNILVPLNDGGLRPDFAMTFGLSLSL